MKVSFLMAIGSIFIGFFSSPIPQQIGFYKLLTKLYTPLVGLMPAFHHGTEWGYSYTELYESCQNNGINDHNSIHGETAIVTGANSGIGYEISKTLYHCGARVTMVCRSPQKCSKAARSIQNSEPNFKTAMSELNLYEIETMTADLSSLKSVQTFALQYLQQHNTKNEGTETRKASLDMLFLNAGMSGRTGKSQELVSKEDGIETTFLTNYLGHHLMFRLLEPLLLQSKMARVIQTSSLLSFFSFPHLVSTSLAQLNDPKYDYFPSYTRYYAQSKLAQVLWTKHLTKLLHERSIHNVYINSVHPGGVSTEIFEKGDMSNPLTKYGSRLVNYFRATLWTAEEGAFTPLFLGMAKDRLQKEQIKGLYFHPQVQVVNHTMALDSQLQSDLWDFSNDLVSSFLEMKKDHI